MPPRSPRAPRAPAKTTARTRAKTPRAAAAATGDAPRIAFATQKAWRTWLHKHYTAAEGVWIQIAKQGSGTPSINHAEALDVALCYGWIDGQAKSLDAGSFIQKFTPRRARSTWSKINRDKVAALIASGAMHAAGQAEIDRAKQDGRWDAAYDGPRTIVVPDDLQAALDRNATAAAFFKTLTSQNRYAILFRIHTAKKAETRARRIEQFVGMLERHETVHP